MGSYCDLYIGNFLVGLWKNSVPSEFISLFGDCDRRVYKRPWGVRKARGWSSVSEENEKNEEELETAYVYQCTVDKAIDRLEIDGFTLKSSKEEFNRYIQEEKERWKYYPRSSVMRVPSDFTFDKWYELTSCFLENNQSVIRCCLEDTRFDTSPYQGQSIFFGSGYM